MMNRYSSRVTQPKSQGASQAMLYGTGMTEEDMNKAQVGIASMWFEGNTCNMHLLDLAEKVKEGVQADTGLPLPPMATLPSWSACPCHESRQFWTGLAQGSLLRHLPGGRRCN